MNTVALAFAAAAGSAFGSFVAVVRERGWRGATRGRSACDGCARPLRWFELVPLVSYPALRGRCRRCRARIGVGVYLWELGGAAAGALALAGGVGVAARL